MADRFFTISASVIVGKKDKKAALLDIFAKTHAKL